MGAEVLVVGPWGTWEELLLGGAVLRHGAHHWDVVAGELRARTASPFIAVTPEICRAKYKDLQRRYSGRKAWFEELRRERIVELKQALEASEDSIGSLESRLEILNGERKSDSQLSYDSSRTESGIPCLKDDGFEFSSKESSKDGLSAGSFTLEARMNWSPEEMETKPEFSVSPQQDNALTEPKVVELGCLGMYKILKGKRGKRKRKYIVKNATEARARECTFWSTGGASATRLKENSTSTSGRNSSSSHVHDHCHHSSIDKIDDLIGIFSSVAEHKCASVFRQRLDSQKRGRYKKMILQHLDFDSIRSRLATGCIASAKQVFRDLLLLANNALVFFSKTTREYKSALLLREVVTKSLNLHLKDYISRTTITLLSTTVHVRHRPTKPRRTRLANGESLGKLNKRVPGVVVPRACSAGKRRSNVESSSPSSAGSFPAVKRKGPGWPTSERASQQPVKHPTRGRNRTRAK